MPVLGDWDKVMLAYKKQMAKDIANDHTRAKTYKEIKGK